MGVIAGATVDFTDYSAPGTPRILNVPDAVGDITVQDLWDTLSEEAAKLENLIYKKLVVRPGFGGKGVLSPTKSIGISMKLNNVQVKFEDLVGPSFTIKRVVDGNLIAQDDVEADLEPLASSDFVNWKSEADVSAAIVQPVLQQGDLDSIADAVHSEDLSAFTTQGEAGDVLRRQAFKEASVWLASQSGNSGTTFPVGTPGTPVDNLTDAKAIAIANGLTRMVVQPGTGFPYFLPAIDLTGFEFVSQPTNNVVFFLAAGQDYSQSTFKGMIIITVGGAIADGTMSMFEGSMGGVEAGSFYLSNVDFSGTLKVSGTGSPGVVVLIKCISRIAAQGIIDFNNANTILYGRQCAGVFTFRNVTNANSDINIGMTDGEIVLDSTCTAGTIRITGTCLVTDNSNGATVIDESVSPVVSAGVFRKLFGPLLATR
jgi:hypothetical protein